MFGGLAHLGERLICIQEVAGSIPVSSTKRKRHQRVPVVQLDRMLVS